MDSRGLLHPLADGFEQHADRADVAVLLHGWTGSPSHLRLLGDDLAAAGFGVVAPLLPGHGTLIHHMLDSTWRDWVEAAATAAQGVVDRGGRLHLCGLSMGGVLSILLATAFEPLSLTTINAPIKVFSRSTVMASLMRGSRRVREYERQEHNPGFAHEYAHHYPGSPIGAVADLMDLIRGAKAALPRVTTPALVVQSLADETVRPESGTYLYDHLASPVKRIVWLETSAHVATLDSERDRLSAEIVRHMHDAQGLAPLQPRD